VTRYEIGVEDCDGDHVHVDIRAIPSQLRPAVVAALAHHLDLEVHVLAKAGRGEGPDPRFPEIEHLVDEVRTRWSRWTRWLVDKLIGRVETRTATPAAVATIMETHEIGVTRALTGTVLETPKGEPLVVDRELLPPQPETTAPISIAFRLGVAADPDNPPRVPEAVREPPPVSTLSDAGRAALTYARSRAAIYLRRPIGDLRQTTERILIDGGIPLDPRALTEEERGGVRRVIVDAIEHGRPLGETTQRLRDALNDAKLTNNVERIARTELAAAHHHGAYVTLRASLPLGADPEVYKITSPQACSECLRIWGHNANPVHYKLSTVEAFTAAGGNYGKKPADWGPTIGPTHPNCACPPLLRWNPAVHDAVQDAAAEMRRIFG
jgi:hypothetical protein